MNTPSFSFRMKNAVRGLNEAWSKAKKNMYHANKTAVTFLNKTPFHKAIFAKLYYSVHFHDIKLP